MAAEVLIILLLILVNGLFTMGEMAIVSARRARLKHMADQGDAGAKKALDLLSDPTKFLSTVQIGITVVNMLIGTFGGASIADRLAEKLSTFDSVAAYAHPISIAVVVVVISYATLILGELAPKRLALANPESLSSALAGFMGTVSKIAAPFGWALTISTDAVLRLLPVREGQHAPVTDDEIKILMQEGTEAGEFHEGERSIVEMALRLGDRRVSALMTPRTQMDVLDLTDPPDVVLAKILDLGHSRFPVVDGDTANVVGILEVRDLAAASLKGEALDIRALMRQPVYIPDTAPALKALALFKNSGNPVALIVDEYGDIEGLVTLNDVLQALVGEIAEPGDPAEQDAVRRADGSWLIDGMMPVDEVEDLIGTVRLHLPDEDPGTFQTLGGFVMASLKRIPSAGDLFELDGYRFEVMDMDGRRVDKVLVSPVEAAAEGAVS
jgi:putative hemolysin